jgi:hypothetical protein
MIIVECCVSPDTTHFVLFLPRVTVLSVNDQKQPIYQESSGIKQVPPTGGGGQTGGVM